MFRCQTLYLVFAVLIVNSYGFSSNAAGQLKPMTRTSFIIPKSAFSPLMKKTTHLNLSEEPKEAPPAEGGALYDDQIPEQSSGISDSMKERLKREAGAGLDADKPQTNVILYISIAVAILVIAGGQGILY